MNGVGKDLCLVWLTYGASYPRFLGLNTRPRAPRWTTLRDYSVTLRKENESRQSDIRFVRILPFFTGGPLAGQVPTAFEGAAEGHLVGVLEVPSDR